MENASKALIIAGAILISILIVGVGVLVFQSIRGTINEGVSQMSDQEKTMFNQQFEQYAGSRVNGASVKALLNKVNSNNVANKDIAGKTITLAGNVATGTSASADVIGKLNTARNYTVVCSDTDGDGLDDTITINSIGK